MLRCIAAFLKTPIGVERVHAPLHDTLAAVVCVSHAWRTALPRKPRGSGNRKVTFVAPRALYVQWLRISQWTFSVNDFAIPVGVLVRRALKETGLPAAFFTCDVDMLAPSGEHPEIALVCALDPDERLVIVNDHSEPEVRGRWRRSFVDVDWAYRSALSPVPKWIFKLPEAHHLLHVEAVMPHLESLVLLGHGSEAILYDLMPPLDD
jgi:hypothetical protein